MFNENTKATNQKIVQIALGELIIAGYQRQTNTTQVNNIAKHFDEAKVNLLVVSSRDGKLYIIDGAHRAAAMRQIGYTHAMCILLEGMTYEEEAEYFRRQNENLSKLNVYHMFKAGLEAGDEIFVRIDAIVNSYEYKVSSSGRSSADHPERICAVNALIVICKVYGYKTLDAALKLIKATWAFDSVALRREFLVGVAEFVNRFGEAEFTERMKTYNSAHILQRYTTSTEYQFGNKSTSCPAMRKAFCESLVWFYNKGLNPNSRKRLIMEGTSDVNIDQ